MKPIILNIQLLDGPLRGRYIEVDETIAKRGIVRLPEPPQPSLREDVYYEMKIHTYETRWTAKYGWIALYKG